MDIQRPELNIALLIDGDNAPAKHIRGLIEELTTYGTPTIKRIYGDWTNTRLTSWKKVLLEYAITPIHQYSYTIGKNATDSAMIIDAMDILYTEKVNGFCIVSSDSDFTRLAIRLREASMKVFGMGERKTPEPFRAACDKFIFLEILDSTSQNNEDEDAPLSDTSTSKKTSVFSKKEHTEDMSSIQKIDRKVIKLICNTINGIADDDGWANLAHVGNQLTKQNPEFDARNFGFPRLTPMLKSMTRRLLIDERKSEHSNTKHVYVKVK